MSSTRGSKITDAVIGLEVKSLMAEAGRIITNEELGMSAEEFRQAVLQGYFQPPKPLNLYQRLNEVRKKVQYIKKEHEVQGQYKVVTHDQITGWVREHLVEHGVMMFPSVSNSWQGVIQDTGMATGKGVPIIRYEASFNIQFVNIDVPQDAHTISIPAHALDQGDKAPGKAMSYAVKYALLKVLNIETGEDEESRIQSKSVDEDPNVVSFLEESTSMKMLQDRWKSLSVSQRTIHIGTKDRIKDELKKVDKA